MKKIGALLLAIVMTLSLAACGEKAETPAPEESPAASAETEETENKIETVETERTSTPEKDGEMLKAYQDALTKLATEGVYPDGTECGFDKEFFTMDQNRFAICDVDGDGADELIISFTAGPMAAMAERVYGYRGSDGQLALELLEFPGVTYYSTHTAEAMLAHSQGLAGMDYWPFSLYVYDAQADSFVLEASVDMWSKEMGEVNYDGESYPQDIDAEGAGTVFIVEAEGGTKTISRSAFEEWYESVVGAGIVLNIPFVPLSEENIAAIAG